MKIINLLLSYRKAITNSFILFCLCFSNFAASAKNESIMVFVHGAHLTASAWQPVAETLDEKGYHTISINLPGRQDYLSPKDVTLNSSARYLCSAVSHINQSITFIAHSQGGAIVNHAQSICPSVKVDRIIYLASVSPLKGEKPFDRLSKEDETNYFKGVIYNENHGLMVINDKNAFAKIFSSSNNSSTINHVLKLSVNEPASIAEGVVEQDSELYSHIKKFYIFTEQDKIISKASQLKIEDSLNTIKTSSIDSGHIPMITHPNKLVPILLDFMSI